LAGSVFAEKCRDGKVAMRKPRLLSCSALDNLDTFQVHISLAEEQYVFLDSRLISEAAQLKKKASTLLGFSRVQEAAVLALRQTISARLCIVRAR
jgi:hypothetical protein